MCVCVVMCVVMYFCCKIKSCCLNRFFLRVFSLQTDACMYQLRALSRNTQQAWLKDLCDAAEKAIKGEIPSVNIVVDSTFFFVVSFFFSFFPSLF